MQDAAQQYGSIRYGMSCHGSNRHSPRQCRWEVLCVPLAGCAWLRGSIVLWAPSTCEHSGNVGQHACRAQECPLCSHWQTAGDDGSQTSLLHILMSSCVLCVTSVGKFRIAVASLDFASLAGSIPYTSESVDISAFKCTCICVSCRSRVASLSLTASRQASSGELQSGRFQNQFCHQAAALCCAHLPLHVGVWSYSHSRLSTPLSLVISTIQEHIVVASVGMELQALMFAWVRFLWANAQS